MMMKKTETVRGSIEQTMRRTGASAQNLGRRVLDVALEVVADNAFVPVQREAKVGDLDAHVVRHEQIRQLQVAMNDVVGVQPESASIDDT